LSHFISKAKEKHGKELHCIVPSGGNAGLAGACAARVLGVKCTVFIPEGVAPSTLTLLKQENAEVVVTGHFYAEAMSAAQHVVAADPAA
jgi:L-serine/L-threonine ammonia-lyase